MHRGTHASYFLASCKQPHDAPHLPRGRHLQSQDGELRARSLLSTAPPGAGICTAPGTPLPSRTAQPPAKEEAQSLFSRPLPSPKLPATTHTFMEHSGKSTLRCSKVKEQPAEGCSINHTSLSLTEPVVLKVCLLHKICTADTHEALRSIY